MQHFGNIAYPSKKKSLKNNKISILVFWTVLFSLNCTKHVLDGNREERDIRIEKLHKGTVSMSFDLINNLVVIPTQINDSGDLYFILDTGAGRTVITELGEDQSFTINYEGDIELSGLGNGGPIPALTSSKNEIYLEGIEGENHSVVLLLESVLRLSNFMGRRVNGLMGYDIFENFIVEIDYKSERLYFHDPDYFKEKYEEKRKDKKWVYVPLEKHDYKIYMNAEITQSDSTKIDVKLLIDSGASHNIFLYPNSKEGINIPPKTVRSYLGSGLSGEIYGDIGRARKIEVNGLELDYPIIAYPDIEGIRLVANRGNRNGSIGADFFRRFSVIFNYNEPSMLLRPNSDYNDDFSYNTSGLEITTPFLRLPYYIVSKVRENSIAEQIGIQANDVLYEINFEPVAKYSLNELLELFHSTRSFSISVIRDDDIKFFHLRLKDETKLEGQS